jgi:hypothetical protein
VDFSRPARLRLCRVPSAADHLVRDGWRMSTDDHAKHIAAITARMTEAFYEIADGEPPGEGIFAATMALAIFIYDLTKYGSENNIAKAFAALLVEAVADLKKEDMN